MRILGVDFGDVRTGLAISDPTGFLATGIGTITERDINKTAKAVYDKCNEYKCSKIVLGLPKNMDGSEGFRADKTKQFKQLLETLFNGEIILIDERMTTKIANSYMNDTDTRGKKRKNTVDTLSAEIILQDYLDRNK